MRTTRQTSRPSRRSRAASSREYGPWSWAPRIPQAPAIRRIWSGDCVAKTPRTGTPAAAATTFLAPSSETVLAPSAKTTPRYPAPASAATAASSLRIIPQNLILATTSGHPRQLLQQPFRRRCRGKRCSHQDRISPGISRPYHIRLPAHPALDHGHAVCRNPPHDLEGRIHVDGKRIEIPTVDADDGGTGVQRGAQLPLGVDLNQRLQSQLRRVTKQGLQPGTQHTDDEQDRRRSCGPGLQDLDFIQHEILEQHRHGGPPGSDPEVLDRSPEKRTIGQDRNRRRVVLGVKTGAGYGVKVFPDRPRRRGPTLNLRDHSHDFPPQSTPERQRNAC